MSDVFGGDDQDHRKDDQDGLEIKLRSGEVWQGKDRGAHDGGKVQDPGDGCGCVSGDHGDQDRDHREKAAEQDGAEHGKAQGHKKYDGVPGIDDLVQKTGVAGSAAGEFQSDEGDHRPHGGRRKDDVDPFVAHLVNDERQDTAHKAHGHEAAQGVFIAPVGNDDACGSQEGEAGSKIGRSLPFGDQDKKQRAQAVHKKNDSRVDPKQEGDQHRRAEHGEHVLDA